MGYIDFIIVTNLAIAIWYFLKKNNEIPFFIALFNLMVQYRMTALKNGYSGFVSYDYGIDFIWNLDYANIASELIVLGGCIMMYSYMLFYKQPRAKDKIKDSNDLLKSFINTRRTQILIGLICFSLLAIVVKGGSGGYAGLISFGNSSFVIMLFFIMSFTDKGNTGNKVFYGILFLFLGYLTYGSGGRFQFLGWVLPVGYYMTRNVRPVRKILFSTVGLFFVLIFFSMAGVLRYQEAQSKSFGDLYDASIDRLKMADDVNFIDGFMMIYQVYPKILDYDYGFEHIEIFLRPIPRSIWPNKPVGSWVRKYQEKYNGEVLNSAGFSPTIWGVFYSEGGVIGIIILSVLWGYMISYIYHSFSSFNSGLASMLIGVLLASLVPVFRSGDMAGDFAIVLMSYWPLILFVRQYKKFLKQSEVVQKKILLKQIQAYKLR
jgi:hypothetical protein